jgi:hypothetical protein
MSPHHQVALNANLGGGWVARFAEFAETVSSIVLVTVERNDERRSLRLDIGKGMFLDPPPADVDQRAARDVTRSIVQQISPLRGTPRS